MNDFDGAAEPLKAARQGDPEPNNAHLQVIYWRTLMAIFGLHEKHTAFDALANELAGQAALPALVLDPSIAVDTVVQRYPELREEFETCCPAPTQDSAQDETISDGEHSGPEGGGADETRVAVDADPSTEVKGWLAEAEAKDAPPAPHQAGLDDEQIRSRRAFIFGKLLLNAFGPNTATPQVTAGQYQQWTTDVAWLEGAFGYAPGTLRGRARGGPPTSGGGGASSEGSGGAPALNDEDLKRGLAALEGDLVRRMELREVLKDSALAAKLSPSMALVEQILRDKSNLSGEALNNARRLVRSYVDQVAEVLKLKVEKASHGKVDRNVPPKRVFRNLDLKKTVWKNLTNWDPKEKRLMVDRLFYRRASQKTLPTRMIVAVDQSGSMVDAMVQSTILASIFAGLPKVDVHLLAFDTQVVDLTPWVSDPFEVLLRTNLGGGTLINMALMAAEKKIEEPKNTALILISDFYEGGPDQPLFDRIKAIADSGVHFIPVGALMSSGGISINEWFKTRLKEIGRPILSGSIDKLIRELRYLLR